LKTGEKSRELAELREKTKLGGGPERIEEQHKKGKMTARERLERLLDRGSFVELDPFVVHQCTDFGMETRRVLGDGVVTGHGTIDGRLVYFFAHDFTVFGGSLGETIARKVCNVLDVAMKTGAPLIGLNDTGGARIQEGVASLAGYGEIFFRNAMASGVIPQLSAIMGPCAGGAACSSAMTDFIVMVKGTSHMFVSSPDVIGAALKKEISMEELGGALVHNQTSGVAHLLSDDEDECLRQIRRLLSYMPSNNLEEPPQVQPSDDANREEMVLDSIVPDNPDKVYDMKDIILAVVDDRDFFEIHELWAQNIVVGFARLNSKSVGIVANQPKVLAGTLDINASVKAGRFVRFCDAFNIPLVTFVDVPGFLPGADQEHGGIIRHASKLLYAYCEASVPKVTVITRKAYGGAYDIMCSKHIRGDINYAWPTAEIAVIGPQGAVNVIFGKEIAQSENPQERINQLTEEYRRKYASPYAAAARGYIDDVIMPHETRPKLIRALAALANKRESRPARKHGNIPL